MLIIFRRHRGVIVFSGLAICLLFAWSAWIVSFDQVIQLGTRTIKIGETLSVFGRDFVLSESERPVISLIYFINAFWILGAYYSKPTRLFVPYSILVVALLTAVIAVEPFLFAAVILELIVLLSVPLLAEPGQKSHKGALRFLAFQTLAMPFILFTSWMVTGVEAGPGDLELLSRAAALLGIGLTFSLAIFPFHSWIPMLAEESPPYLAAYIFFVFPLGVSLFALGLLDRFVWLRESGILISIVQILGGIMVFVGGFWAGVERHLGRILGFAAIMEIGYTLLSISLIEKNGLLIYFWLFIPRLLAYVLWAMSLSKINRDSNNNINFGNIRGVGLQSPFSSIGVLIGNFTLAGIPFLAAFPGRLVIWEALAKSSPIIASGTIIGSIALIVAGLRTLSVLFVSKPLPIKENSLKISPLSDSVISEDKMPLLETDSTDRLEKRIFLIENNWVNSIIWGLFFLLIIYVGNFPQFYIRILQNFLSVFEHFGQ
ncbi:MAG: hypothetical protein HON98_10530 [Chloroflexi bacterium]|nr:hypothetical protein [Chloroflexota bacterium]MBT3670656.1 hypothetical protein [Chloroflexota bacterium]MBT4756103.1 hypothetical protein [Chloroflexota bacterium]MBT6358614.1 hypothetical protein [Chloroflexota bacterium]